jgi:hypothetical protein
MLLLERYEHGTFGDGALNRGVVTYAGHVAQLGNA